MLRLEGQAWSDRHHTISRGEQEIQPLMGLIKATPVCFLEHFRLVKLI